MYVALDAPPRCGRDWINGDMSLSIYSMEKNGSLFYYIAWLLLFTCRGRQVLRR